MGPLANNSASQLVWTKIVGAVDGEQVTQSHTRAVHSALNRAGGATAQSCGLVVKEIRSAH
jgi:hypothetical protein